MRVMQIIQIFKQPSKAILQVTLDYFRLGFMTFAEMPIRGTFTHKIFAHPFPSRGRVPLEGFMRNRYCFL